MSLIYEPRGRAAEYSSLALNIYNGCDHRCSYCYVEKIPFGINKGGDPKPRAGLDKLDAELTRRPVTRQVLLSFMSDPYCHAETIHRATRKALETLLAHGAPTAILTKGGMRCLDDLDLFKRFRWVDEVPLKVGATLTFVDAAQSAQWEPDAALPALRIIALEKLHATGIRTWASLEPVIDPDQSLKLILLTHGFVDEYRVGRWNHDARANAIDWKAFGMSAVNLLRSLGKPFYIKADLRTHLPAGFLATIECDQNALNIGEKP